MQLSGCELWRQCAMPNTSYFLYLRSKIFLNCQYLLLMLSLEDLAILNSSDVCKDNCFVRPALINGCRCVINCFRSVKLGRWFFFSSLADILGKMVYPRVASYWTDVPLREFLLHPSLHYQRTNSTPLPQVFMWVPRVFYLHCCWHAGGKLNSRFLKPQHCSV